MKSRKEITRVNVELTLEELELVRFAVSIIPDRCLNKKEVEVVDNLIEKLKDE